ncbi:UNVERIFIED_CONTAM: hypothetical protein Sradi_7179600 [Sesamum radiatum]|uniref:Uncharacterized protein n=1 Tax=Sesamum radiatum TaxID=300843 RepID=A0AAW2ITV1_SESRA
MKWPEGARQIDDYCKYHRLVGHSVQDCLMFKDKVMQLARQGKISLENDSTTSNFVSTKYGYFHDREASCNTAHTINENDLLEKKDSSNADECISTITFMDEDLLLGSKPHNRPLFVVGSAREQKINMKQLSKLPPKEFVPSTQEEEKGHEVLAIDEKEFDPKAFKLLLKVGYNPEEKLSLEKLPPKATGKKLHMLE